MTPVEMHLEPFGNELKFMPEPFRQYICVTLGIDYFSPKGFSSSGDDLLNFRQRFLIHKASP